MTGLSLSKIVSDELAKVGPLPDDARKAAGRVRQTIWSPRWPGFGLRLYASGRRTWVVQARMDERVRAVIIGDARIITKAQASDVARRVLLRAQVGENPAKDRAVSRTAPRYEDFWRSIGARCLFAGNRAHCVGTTIAGKTTSTAPFAGAFSITSPKLTCCAGLQA